MLMVRLAEAMIAHRDELGDGPPMRRITALIAAGFGVTKQLPPEHQVAWRELATDLLRVLDSHGTGLLITIDEIHAVDRGDLLELAAAIQHLIREDLPISLLTAGIPKAVSDLLNEDVSTFLRRADRIDLGHVPLSEIPVAHQI